MNILLVCAHADDETIGMGGTLKKLSKYHNIKVLFLTDSVSGRRGSGHINSTKYEISDAELKKMKNDIKIRKKQAYKALKILGIKNVRMLDIPSQELDQIPFLKIIKEIENEIEKNKFNIIFTHHYNDLNLDHRIAYEATITAARPLPNSSVSAILSFEIPSSTEWRRPHKFNPNLYVDISSEIKTKIKALESYTYEIQKYPHPRSKEITEAVAKRWGSLSGFKSAEAFEIIMSRMTDMNKMSIY